MQARSGAPQSPLCHAGRGGAAELPLLPAPSPGGYCCVPQRRATTLLLLLLCLPLLLLLRFASLSACPSASRCPAGREDGWGAAEGMSAGSWGLRLLLRGPGEAPPLLAASLLLSTAREMLIARRELLCLGPKPWSGLPSFSDQKQQPFFCRLLPFFFFM